VIERNSHQAPDEVVRIWVLAIVVFAALQAALSFKYAPVALDFFKHGDMSPISFLCAALSVICMTLAAALLLARIRANRIFFGLSALFSLFVLLQWRPSITVTLLTISCLVISAAAYVFSAQLTRPRAKV